MENNNEFDFSLRESLNTVKGQVDLLYYGALEDADEEEQDSFLEELRTNTESLYDLLNSSIVEKANEIKEKNKLIQKLLERAEYEKQKSDKLILNILPKEIIEELKREGYSKTRKFEHVTVLFTDFVGFTQIAESLSAEELINELEACFDFFDEICSKYNLEKLKTIGDSYMLAGGIPTVNKSNPVDVCLAAIEIKNFMLSTKKIKQEMGLPYWEIRIGIHTGELIAGIIGKRKLQYDIWGDTVNTASRMESSGEPGMINVSDRTYNLVKDFFDCKYRGKIPAKRKGELDMYFINGIKKELSENQEGLVPNEDFKKTYINKYTSSGGNSLFAEESNIRFFNLHNKAIALLKEKSYQESLQILLQLHSMDKNNISILNNLAVVYCKLNRHQKALDVLNSSIKHADGENKSVISHNIELIKNKMSS